MQLYNGPLLYKFQSELSQQFSKVKHSIHRVMSIECLSVWRGVPYLSFVSSEAIVQGPTLAFL